MDTQKVQNKYGSGDGVDAPLPKNCLHFGTHMVMKTLDGGTCKKCIISTLATYIWHTWEKVWERTHINFVFEEFSKST